MPVSNLIWKSPNVAAASTVNVVGTFADPNTGPGDTLTASGVGVLTLDGYTPVLNDRVLLKNQTAGLQNGIYSFTQVPVAGIIATIGAIVQPTSGTIPTGTFQGIILTGGTGSGARATVVTSGGSISTTGTITQPTGGTITNGTYTAVPLTGGSGSGAQATLVVAGGGPSINLATAVTYGVIASSTITNNGATTITGNLALTPGSSVTGAPTVTGTSNIDNPAAVQAKSDAQSAYTYGQALTPFTTIPAELGGTSPAPGIYQFTGGAASITTALTLTGSATSVWIFQIASTLTSAGAGNVVLTGGALAKNVYWLVGTNATLGASSTFNGTLIANATITVGTSATVTGHLFSLTTAVNLDTNTVTATPAGTVSVGSVTSVTITAAGTGYLVGDILGFTRAGLGTGGTVTLTGVADDVTQVNVTNPGAGYTIGDVLTYNAIGQGFGNGGTVTVGTVNTSATNGGGILTTTGFTQPLNNFVTNGNYQISLTGGTGIGAIANITVVGGVVTSIVIINPGTGYLSTDVLGFSGGGLGTGGTIALSTITFTPWVLERSSDANLAFQVEGMAAWVANGSTQIKTVWTQTVLSVIIDTTPLVFTQYIP